MNRARKSPIYGPVASRSASMRPVARSGNRTGRCDKSTADPHAALRLARRPGSIHLLLTDVVISLMSGCQLAQEFRKVRPEAKVLFMSGYNVEAAEAYRVELAPGEPFLKKPFTMDELQR